MEMTQKKSRSIDLTYGPIIKGMLQFCLPFFIGQLLQQFYNLADAWVIGNFADNSAFAAVSNSSNLIWLITGFCLGLATGGGVIISRYYGAKDEQNTIKAIHNNFIMGIATCVLATVVGLILCPKILVMMNTPIDVLPASLTYFRIYFIGVSTVVMYNICMAIMRSLGDTINPLIYLVISSIANIILDLLFVAGFKWSVAGAAIATVLSQGLSVVLCIIKMLKKNDYTRLSMKNMIYDGKIMKEILVQGLPTGIQNSVISIGNVVVQSNINSFGSYAMSGYGAYVKIEGFVFLPITCFSTILPTFVSQNLGAGKCDRAKKGAFYGVGIAVILSELIGFVFMFAGKYLLSFFISDPEALYYGLRHVAIAPIFYCLVSFSHCAAGALRGCGKSIVPMVAMLFSWCFIRVIFVTFAVQYFQVYDAIVWAYPLTWSITTIIFLIFLLRIDWNNLYR